MGYDAGESWTKPAAAPMPVDPKCTELAQYFIYGEEDWVALAAAIQAAVGTWFAEKQEKL
jgi:hypothetical protein